MNESKKYARGGLPRYEGDEKYRERHRVSLWITGKYARVLREASVKTGYSYAELTRIALVAFLRQHEREGCQ